MQGTFRRLAMFSALGVLLAVVVHAQERTERDRDRERSGQAAGSTTIIKASSLIGYKVKNQQGENLGEIEDLAIDVQEGRIAYAVLSFGGFLGLGDKLFAIPWNALQPRHEEQTFVLNVDKEQLRRAPGFDKDRWPDMADRQWGAEVHQFYRTRPYWESGSTSGAQGQPGTGRFEQGQPQASGTGRFEQRGQGVTLPLKLEQGKTLSFNLEPAKGGSQQQFQQDRERDQQQQREREQLREQSSGQTGSQQGFAVKIKVQDWQQQSGGTLMVTLEKGGSSGSRFGQSPQGGQGGQQQQSGQKTFTVKVDGDGRIQSFQPAQGGSTQGQSREQAREQSREQAGQGGQQQLSTELASMGCSPEEFRNCLMLVCGTGLHQRPLQEGMTYSGSQLFQSTGSSFGQGQPGQFGQSGQSGQTTSMKSLDWLTLRFEGRTQRQGEELAHFTILSSQSGTSPARGQPGQEGLRPSAQQEQGREREQQQERESGAVRGTERGSPIGHCYYRIEDGCLQELTFQQSPQSTGGAGTGAATAQGQLYNIKRTQ